MLHLASLLQVSFTGSYYSWAMCSNEHMFLAFLKRRNLCSGPSLASSILKASNLKVLKLSPAFGGCSFLVPTLWSTLLCFWTCWWRWWITRIKSSPSRQTLNGNLQGRGFGLAILKKVRRYRRRSTLYRRRRRCGTLSNGSDESFVIIRRSSKRNRWKLLRFKKNSEKLTKKSNKFLFIPESQTC